MCGRSEDRVGPEVSVPTNERDHEPDERGLVERLVRPVRLEPRLRDGFARTPPELPLQPAIEMPVTSETSLDRAGRRPRWFVGSRKQGSLWRHLPSYLPGVRFPLAMYGH